MRRSDLSLNRYRTGGFIAGASRVTAAVAPMSAIPAVLAFQATAWATTSHVAKGNTPRPLELPGGSTG